jgi:hypothetical protein
LVGILIYFQTFLIEVTEAYSPLGRVASWVKETARKTVRIFTSFRDRFWRDDELEENEICPSTYEQTDMRKHRQLAKVTTVNDVSFNVYQQDPAEVRM